MTKQELKDLVAEAVKAQLEQSSTDKNKETVDEIQEAEAYLEHCEYVEETLFDAYVEEYVLDETYMDDEEMALIESCLLETKKSYYNNANKSMENRDRKHQLLRAALNKKQKVKEAFEKVKKAVRQAISSKKAKGQSLSKSEILMIAKEADTDHVLNTAQIEKTLSTEGLLDKINISNVTDKVDSTKANVSSSNVDAKLDNAEKFISDIKTPNGKEKFINSEAEVLSGDVLDADGKEIKEKLGAKIARKLGDGFKWTGDKITTTFKNDDGSLNRKAVAIAGLASAIVVSSTAAVALRAKKKAQKSKEEAEKK